MTPHFKKVAIIGVGLIGGSLGMILRRQKMAATVVGIGRRVENLKTAVEMGAIDRYVSDPREGVEDAAAEGSSTHNSAARAVLATSDAGTRGKFVSSQFRHWAMAWGCE